MRDDLQQFEVIARTPRTFTSATQEISGPEDHPFDQRNIHPDLPKKVRRLYDDGHFAESAFAAFKFVETEVKRVAKTRGKTGFALMMQVFNESAPDIALNALASDSEEDEQRGYRYMFAGAQAGIRNPRGHDDVVDTPDQCLDHLSLASLLLRKLDDAGVR